MTGKFLFNILYLSASILFIILYITYKSIMLRTIIIEDEVDAQNLLSSILEEYCPDIESISIASSVKDGISLIKESDPHILFLDIQLGLDEGFQILDEFIKPNFKVIFTTAYSDYALKAFEYQAIDYILKPFGPKQVIESVSRAAKSIQNERMFEKLDQLNGNKSKNTKISIPTAEGLLLLDQDEIIRVQADRSYCKVFLTGDNVKVVSKPLKQISSILPTDLFIRPHSGHLVNLKYISKLSRKDGGYLELNDGVQVPISRIKKTEIFNRLQSSI